MRGGFRVERDIMGTVKVPKDAYYGNQTVRAANNFQISNQKIHPTLNQSLIQIKKACALANYATKALDQKHKRLIVSACDDILKHPEKYANQFILDVFQAGAGTPWHMNVNEVIANKALELAKKKKGDYSFLDPHDHVNMSQSTNDVMMSALRIAALQQLEPLYKAIISLTTSLNQKGSQFKSLVKSGRTHLQDAVPITLGQEFDAWSSDITKRLATIKHASLSLHQLHLGGTAVGTGFNAPKGFDSAVIKNIKVIAKLPLTKAKNKIELTQFMSDFLDISSSLRTLATDLTKITNDIRLLSSGPRTSINEVMLPQVEPGSSIMPSKFNPSIPEMLNMVCFQVMGNDHTIQQAAEAGQLELNVFGPVIAHNLLQSIDLLNNALTTFTNKCIKGIKANKEVLQYYYEMSPSIGAALNPVIGYERAAAVIKEAIKSNKSVKQVVVDKGILSKRVAEKLLSA